MNIVKKEKDGRDYKLSLTKKGERVSKIFAELVHVIKNFKTQKPKEEIKNDATTTEGSAL